MAKIYFSNDFIVFFKKLEKNNNREWFNHNKTWYEEQVKKPFEHFITDLLVEIHKVDSSIQQSAKDVIFRINRDTRFSKSKEPYKTAVSAGISAGGKDPSWPGIFIECNSKEIFLMGGVYHLEKQPLEIIRNAIMQQHREFRKLINTPAFKKAFTEVTGEKNKVLSEPFKSFSKTEPLIANKQFIYTKRLPTTMLLHQQLLNSIVSDYKACLGLNQFFISHLKEAGIIN